MEEKKTILLVEDTVVAREILKEALTNVYGYEVIDFSGGVIACNSIEKTKPRIDAAVLDVAMMGHGGSVASFLRKIPQYKDIPIIFHTSMMREQLDKKVLEGAHYVQKSQDSVTQVGKILRDVLGS